MKNKIVIDTNIWVKALKEQNWSCRSAIFGFIGCSELILVLDNGNQILAEYYRNVPGRRFQQIYLELHRKSRISYHPSTLPEVIHDELVKRGFHEPEDLIFVGTAMHADRVIVTEDSDYGHNPEKIDRKKKSVAQYMEEHLGLNVLDSNDFYREYEMMQ